MFKCPKPNSRYAVSSLKEKVIYSPEYFGISDNSLRGTGRGVRVCIIDTGYPNHKSIPVSLGDAIDFSDSKKGARDEHGHATGVAGIIKGTGEIQGLAPSAEIIYAKGISDSGLGKHSAVQASILYAIVKRVDVIVMSFGCDIEHPLLRDAIQKAARSGICLFSAAGNINSKKQDMVYPAKFPEVMAVGYVKGDQYQEIPGAQPGVAMPYKSLDTMYRNDKYIKMSGTSILTPVMAGMACRLIESYDKKMTPKQIYSALTTLCCR